MSDHHYTDDGLCGIEDPHSPRTCQHGMGHEGGHSWETRPSGIRVFGGITRAEIKERAAKGGLAAQVMLAVLEKKP